MGLWLLVFFYKLRKTYFDSQFISIAILYNIFLAGCYVYRQNTGDKETSHLFGVGISIAITTIVVIRSAIKYKYFKK